MLSWKPTAGPAKWLPNKVQNMESLSIQALKFIYCTVMVLLLFNLTIFVHEYGHYLLARWRKLKVDEFSLWFGPPIWQKKIGDVLFSLRSIPLGGYVKLPQLQPDDPIEGKSEIPKEELPYARPIDRIPTLFAGSFFNMLFAILIASILWVVGIPVDKSFTDTTIGYVPDQSVEAAAGLRVGDKIIAINGIAVQDWLDIKAETVFANSTAIDVSVLRNGKVETVRFEPSKNALGIREIQSEPKQTIVVHELVRDMPAERAGFQLDDVMITFDGQADLTINQLMSSIATQPGKECSVVVDRHGKRVTLHVTPEFNASEKKGMIGVKFGDSETALIHPNPVKQITEVVLQMTRIVNAIFHQKQTGIGVKDLSGPIGIIDILYNAVASDIRLALYFLVLLNVNLAIINLLPLPVLDGGHIVFTLLEWVRKKPLNQRLMEGIQTAFVILLLAFVVYVSFNDVKRLRIMHGFKPKEANEKNIQPPPATQPAANK